MKICIAQTRSEKGDVLLNLENHLGFVERAVTLNSDLIIFPELSMTNYEPGLAKELATNVDDPIFSPLQDASDNHEITIGVGMPTKSKDGTQISMLIFQPCKETTTYSKQILHSDELPYFVCGNHQTILKINDFKIALGICYETLKRKHFLDARTKGADVYIASVAKPEEGIRKAYKHFKELAGEFHIPILMSNCVGPCDNFTSAGQSAVWNKNGELVERLDSNSQGLLVYGTTANRVEVLN